jgi:hypothetical protein
MASAPVTRSAARMASAPGREACGDASEFITIEVIMEDGRPGHAVDTLNLVLYSAVRAAATEVLVKGGLRAR